VAAGATFGFLTVHHRAPRFHSPEEIAFVTFLGEQMGCAIERDRLALENAQLRQDALRLKGQLELRKLIERAKGILQRQLNVTEEQAYLRLRNESRRLRKPMAELARAILLNGGYLRGGEASRAAG
jgi:uroporphyrinogen-III synthase